MEFKVVLSGTNTCFNIEAKKLMVWNIKIFLHQKSVQLLKIEFCELLG